MIAIGEAARQSGVKIETIRYYEREGIVPAPERAANNRRLYSAEAVDRLRFLKKCRDLGFPLSGARTLLELSEGQAGPCDVVKEMAERHVEHLRARILELQHLEAALTELTANCDSGNTSCPMLAQMRSHAGM